MQTKFEITTQQKQLAAVGRDMMDYSEDYGKIHGLRGVTDNGLRVLNELSRVGAMLTRFGETFGTTQRDYSEEDMALIVAFMQKKVDIERK